MTKGTDLSFLDASQQDAIDGPHALGQPTQRESDDQDLQNQPDGKETRGQVRQFDREDLDLLVYVATLPQNAEKQNGHPWGIRSIENISTDVGWCCDRKQVMF